MNRNNLYSKIALEDFYQIYLDEPGALLVDSHFMGAAHHLNCWINSRDLHPSLFEFHLVRFGAHLRHLYETVYVTGDFSLAVDPSERNLHQRKTWSPNLLSYPHETMFKDMVSDERVPMGKEHPYDRLLHSLAPPQTLASSCLALAS